MKKKKAKRTWRGIVSPTPIREQSPVQEWQVVMAELNKGTASVGIRFNREDTVHFFMLHKSPQEATQAVADIANGKLTLQDIARYDWRAVDLPLGKESEGEP